MILKKTFMSLKSLEFDAGDLSPSLPLSKYVTLSKLLKAFTTTLTPSKAEMYKVLQLEET